MKYLKSTAIVVLLLGLSATAFAQQRRTMQDPPGQGMVHRGDMDRSFYRLPDLTDEQQEQIRQLRLENREAMLPLQNQLREKQARLGTLTTGAEPDLQAANTIIEEIGALRTDMMKKRLEHRMGVRNLLTDEQRIVFDSLHGPGMRTGLRGTHRGARMKRGPGGR